MVQIDPHKGGVPAKEATSREKGIPKSSHTQSHHTPKTRRRKIQDTKAQYCVTLCQDWVKIGRRVVKINAKMPKVHDACATWVSIQNTKLSRLTSELSRLIYELSRLTHRISRLTQRLSRSCAPVRKDRAHTNVRAISRSNRGLQSNTSDM